MNENTPPPMPMPEHVSGVVSAPPAVQQSVSVERLQMPLLMTAGLVVAIAGGIASFAVAWARTSEHVGDTYVHIDQGKAIAGGGIAFQHDVQTARAEVLQKVAEESKKTRKLVHSLTLDCTKTAVGLGCKVSNLPDPE